MVESSSSSSELSRGENKGREPFFLSWGYVFYCIVSTRYLMRLWPLDGDMIVPRGPD